MDAILQKTSSVVLDVIQTWESVETVMVLRFGSDRYDPSFFISYDVYHRGGLPDNASRTSAFQFAVGFESTRDGQKDRLLIDNVPVRLEYKSISDIDGMVDSASRSANGDTLHNTYGFYRIVKGEAILERGTWLKEKRESLLNLPEVFWIQRSLVLQARMDHVLADLSSAVLAGEDLFYQLSLAAFLQALCSLLFAINQQFEPAGRSLSENLLRLPILPEEFSTRLAYLLRSDAGITDKRKREVAELITKSVLRIA